ncbi:hypothetical protein OG393_10695 [Streptomyces sp. NBC_01216]|uniref:hypothetical protein n=1 Tax=Streptomyces sp. NBC_01216 TaxID=2903778 RepID=UPI002E15A9FD|nr:hypothetical protein OG393_10695 [Streptomyces sp. NBC_01216]
MSARYATQIRKGTIAVVLAALVLSVAGCGSEDEAPRGKASASTADPKPTAGGKGAQTEEPAEVLAILKGPEGFELVINSARRDAGGFVTVKGLLKNASGKGRAVPVGVQGNETEVLKHGSSFGGASLVDSREKKRYYVLRDTDGRPLTTTGLSLIGAGESAAVFMQFPAPPAGTTEVMLQLPTFDPGTIKLS